MRFFLRPERPSKNSTRWNGNSLLRVALKNGTFKTTYPNRLDDINKAFFPHVLSLAGRPIRIMDVGASSGISTM